MSTRGSTRTIHPWVSFFFGSFYGWTNKKKTVVSSDNRNKKCWFHFTSVQRVQVSNYSGLKQAWCDLVIKETDTDANPVEEFTGSTFRMGAMKTESPVRRKTQMPVTLCSLQWRMERGKNNNNQSMALRHRDKWKKVGISRLIFVIAVP